VIHGEIKTWRDEGPDGAGWYPVIVGPGNFNRFLRTTPIRGLRMNEDAIVLDKDGHWQKAHDGDVVVLDDGYLRVEHASAFNDQHRQVAERRILRPGGSDEELDEVREILAVVLHQTVATHLGLAADDDLPEWAFDTADSVMATMAML
jgi:hypothetical protein